MARHRDVRRLKYDDDYEDDDFYGRSVEDDLALSPSTEQFMYRRGEEKATDLFSLMKQQQQSSTDETTHKWEEAVEKTDGTPLVDSNTFMSNVGAAEFDFCNTVSLAELANQSSSTNLADISTFETNFLSSTPFLNTSLFPSESSFSPTDSPLKDTKLQSFETGPSLADLANDYEVKKIPEESISVTEREVDHVVKSSFSSLAKPSWFASVLCAKSSQKADASFCSDIKAVPLEWDDVKPFDFSEPSPDDVALQKQAQAFGLKSRKP